MYNFNQMIDRRNTNSLKWEVADNELPLWVADMDFQTAPAVIEALTKKAQAGVFGYSIVPDAWYDAIGGWWQRRHNFTMKKDWMIFCTGVIPAVSCAVNRLTNVGDNVLVQTPVYDIFFHSIENHGRHVLENQLVYRDGQYSIDFEDLEQKLSHPLTRLMLLCNPQNPSGKIWSKEELGRIGDLCAKYHVIVMADEIHGDLTDPDKAYTPFASVSERCRENSITCVSPSKAFNIAGLQSAAVVIPNENLRQIMERGLNSTEIAEPNVFAIDGVVAAYTSGEAWLDELRDYIYENKQMVAAFLEQELPELELVASEATYLLWIDCSKLLQEGQDVTELYSQIRRKTGLYLSAGSQYRGDGRHFLRMNIACPKERLADALERLKRGIRNA